MDIIAAALTREIHRGPDVVQDLRADCIYSGRRFNRCYGSHQTLRYGVWPPGWTASNFLIWRVFARCQYCQNVNSDLLIELLGGLECSTVVGRGGTTCECCCVVVSNMLRVGDAAPSFPFRFCWERTFFRYFRCPIAHMFDRSISSELENAFYP